MMMMMIVVVVVVVPFTSIIVGILPIIQLCNKSCLLFAVVGGSVVGFAAARFSCAGYYI